MTRRSYVFIKSSLDWWYDYDWLSDYVEGRKEGGGGEAVLGT